MIGRLWTQKNRAAAGFNENARDPLRVGIDLDSIHQLAQTLGAPPRNPGRRRGHRGETPREP